MVVVVVVCDVLKESVSGNWLHDFMFSRSDCLLLETVLHLSFFDNRSGSVVALNVITCLPTIQCGEFV